MLFLFYVTLWFILRGASCFVMPCALSSCFFGLFSIVIISLGEEGASLCVSRAFVCLLCARYVLSFYSSSWCQGLAAASDCGNPWILLLILGHITKMVAMPIYGQKPFKNLLHRNQNSDET